MFYDISPGNEMGAHLKLLFYPVALLVTCFIFFAIKYNIYLHTFAYF